MIRNLLVALGLLALVVLGVLTLVSIGLMIYARSGPSF
jgi:hypothetical protein